jgi:hypothetical protein
MMMDIFDYLKSNQPLWANIAALIGLITALFTFLHFVWKGIKALYHAFNRESLYRRLKPYFTRREIRGAVDNYIPTQCRNVDPSAAAEPARVHAFAVRQKLVPFFIKKVFREKKEEKYYLVLADSGMGKTTFMINLFLKYMRKRFKKYHMILLPLGHPKADEKIGEIENKTDTILLLDAFDEDIRAAKDYKTRMQELIDKTTDFQAVIITSRTQFFPSDPDIPQETGLYKFGGKKGVQKFYRLYVSPFNEKEVNRYLRRKYSFYLWFKRRKARAIVEKSPDLMVRPMLLANINDLLERREPYEYTYEIYEEMVQRWINRENVKDKEELRKFSEAVAVDMYNNQQHRGGLFIEKNDIGQFAQGHGIRLGDLEMRSRSLLNRNAEGRYKFAHKSILEYLLSLELMRNPSFRVSFNFDNMEQTRRFYKEQFFFQPLEGTFRLSNKKEGPEDAEGQITDIRKIDLNELENISSLNLGFNGIADITALSELKNLQSLGLSNNQITDITPLKELKNINKLALDKNQITDITLLKELKRLKYLFLEGNPIKDAKTIEELRRELEKRGGKLWI